MVFAIGERHMAKVAHGGSTDALEYLEQQLVRQFPEPSILGVGIGFGLLWVVPTKSCCHRELTSTVAGRAAFDCECSPK